jgi:hypothetical protein
MRSDLTPARIWLARGIALAADAVQVAALPLFLEGALSPVQAVLDVLVAVLMVSLLGWHWAFLPTFVAELIPVLDIVPTWTAAVLFATRGGARKRSTPAPRVED